MDVDAIVNAANSSLLGGGGVDGAIHRAAGPGLLAECRTLGGCAVGQAKLTGGYNLPARHVIHTVGPVWQGGRHNEARLLADCYRNSLELAWANRFASLAFPLISSGVYGYPKDQALQIAVQEISEFLLQHDLMVYLVFLDKSSFQLSEKLMTSIRSFLDSGFAAGQPSGQSGAPQSAAAETFSEMLGRLMAEKGLSEEQTYRRANMDRNLFVKIRQDRYCQPGKPVALALAIALGLSLDQTEEFLRRAGLTLSPGSKSDRIIEYFIRNGNYDIFEINEALFAFDQTQLGGAE